MDDVKRTRFMVNIRNCCSQEEVNKKIESDFRKHKFEKIISIQESNLNDCFCEVIVYHTGSGL